MNHCQVEIMWADGTYSFRLKIGNWRELRDKTGAGPQELYRRVLSGTWYVDDLRETIRIGLIGGGMAPVDALKLVSTYVDERPLLESLPVALQIIAAGLVTPEGDEPKKANRQGVRRKSSALPTSMVQVQ